MSINREAYQCKICGMEIEKNEKTEKMERLFANIWCDKEGRFGLNQPHHWHEANSKTTAAGF